MQHCEKVRAKQCDRDRSTRGMVEGELSVAVALVGSKAGLDSCGSAKIFRDRQLFPASLLLFQLSREKFLKTLFRRKLAITLLRRFAFIKTTQVVRWRVSSSRRTRRQKKDQHSNIIEKSGGGRRNEQEGVTVHDNLRRLSATCTPPSYLGKMYITRLRSDSQGLTTGLFLGIHFPGSNPRNLDKQERRKAAPENRRSAARAHMFQTLERSSQPRQRKMRNEDDGVGVYGT